MIRKPEILTDVSDGFVSGSCQLQMPGTLDLGCLQIKDLYTCLLWKAPMLESHWFIRDLSLQGLRALACLEFSWQILGRQLFSTWIWSPSQVSSFVTERLGEERWVEMSADLLLAIYSFKVQEPCQKDMWPSAQLPESRKGPLALGFQGHSSLQSP